MIHMNETHFISVLELGGSPVLGGASTGTSVQRKVVTELFGRRLQVCCLDFSGVECATASFLREAVFGTREALRRNGSSTQVIIANGNQQVQEELLLLAQAQGAPLLHATGSVEKFTHAVVLGELDEAQGETLQLVLKLGEATASDLASKHPSVKPTAWNNRLSARALRGLLTEGRRDRHKVYRPVVKGMSYGS